MKEYFRYFIFSVFILKGFFVFADAGESDIGFTVPAADSSKSRFIKLYPLSCMVNRWSAGFEWSNRRGISFELQPRVILPFLIFAKLPQLLTNLAFLSKGVELFAGVNFNNGGNENKKPSATGLYFSYRYQHTRHEKYWSGGISGRLHHFFYDLAQTRHMVGVFYRRADFRIERFSIFGYFQVGTYLVFSRTMIFSMTGYTASGYGTFPVMKVGNPAGLFRPNGFSLMPQVTYVIVIRARIPGKST